MKSWLTRSMLLVGSGLVSLAYAEAPPPIPGQSKTAPAVNQVPPIPTPGTISEKVYLGISVVKPGAALYAQLPKLPRGAGFLLQSVSVGGTAHQAGLQPMDLIWKLGDQLLINENQLMVLLSHYNPGDKVTVSYFRSGESKEMEVELKGGLAEPLPPENIAISPPFQSLPMRVISYEDRSASISDKTGTATLTYREGELWLHVESDKGEETFNGAVASAEQRAAVPPAWKSRLPVLQRSLEESIRMRRLPRVRRVPAPKHRVAGGE